MDVAGAVLLGAIEGRDLIPAERELFVNREFAGITLFTRNVPENYLLVADLVRDVAASRPVGTPPLLIAIDQEGGRVARIKAPFPDLGPAMHVAGGKDDTAALGEIRDGAKDIATRLRRLGINVDFAPVADVLTEPTNIAIGDRAWSADVGPASTRAKAFLDGLTAGGVLGCLKHFPGQGDAKVDTHAGRAVVDLPLATLKERELAPFRAMLRDVPMVMISHCIYPALDTLPASLSAKIMKGLLREEMGFDGVIVSDDMNMGALPQEEAAWREAIVEAVAAGADLVLVCRRLDRCIAAHEALTKAAAKSRPFRERLTDAATRVTKLRQRLAVGVG